MMTFICNYCKKPYQRVPSEAITTRYCSIACRAKASRRPEIRCKGCHRLFHSKRFSHTYCSPECKKKHVGETRMHRVTKRCLRCGKVMSVPWSRRNRKNYCSVKCRGENRRVKRVPTADQLQHLVIFMGYEQIAQQYNVCTNTVMNWARRYGVKSPYNKKQPRGPGRPSPSGYIGEAYGA